MVIGKDKGDGSLRKQERPGHLSFVSEKQAMIVYAGPLLEDGRMVGSIFVFDVPDRETLDAYLSEDPYFTGRILETIEIYDTHWMVPERDPRALAAEVERARQQ